MNVLDYDYVEVSPAQLSAVESLVKMSRDINQDGFVKSRKDWEAVNYLWRYFKANCPVDYRFWKEEIKQTRKDYKLNNKHGVKEEAFGASLQHTATYPRKFMHIFHSFFPNQDISKREFIRGLIDEIPEFRIHEDSKV